MRDRLPPERLRSWKQGLACVEPALEGRDAELVQLEAFLAGPPGRVLLVLGGPGMGKSSLVAHALGRRGQAPRPEGLCWLDTRSTRRLSELRRAARAWGWSEALPPRAAHAVQFLEATWAVQDAVVVLDDVTPDALAQQGLPLGLGEARTIVLARDEAVATLLPRIDGVVRLQALTADACLELLRLRRVDWPGSEGGQLPAPADQAAWLELCAAVGHLPLGMRVLVEQARLALRESGAMALPRLQKALRPQPADRGHGLPPPVVALVRTAIEALSPDARRLLHGIVAAGGDYFAQTVESLAPSQQAGGHALVELSSHGLCEVRSYSDLTAWVPGPIADLVAAPGSGCSTVAGRGHDHFQAALARHLAPVLQYSADQHARRPALLGLSAQAHELLASLGQRGALPLALQLLDGTRDGLIDVGMADDLLLWTDALWPLVVPGTADEATLLHLVGAAHLALDEAEVAAAFLQQAQTVLQALPPEVPPARPRSRTRFAPPEQDTGVDLDDWLAEGEPDPPDLDHDAPPERVAVADSDRWLLAFLRSLAPHPARTERMALVAGELARCHRRQGRPVAAMDRLARVLPTLRRLPRMDWRARWLAEAAQAYADAGELSAAAGLQAQAAAAWAATEQDLAEAEALEALASIRQKAGAFREAGEARQQAQDRRDRFRRRGDPWELRQRAQACLALGRRLADQGDWEGARRYLAEAVQAWRQLDVPDSDARIATALKEMAELGE